MHECSWFTYAAAPKCGNNWFFHTLIAAGVEFHKGGTHTPGRADGKPRVTIVREPATWLRSWFLNLFGEIEQPPVDVFLSLRDSNGQSFEELGWRYVREMPGQITRMFMHYESEIELRTEHLRQDTLALIDALGIPCDRELIETREREGVTNRTAAMSHKLRAAINKADYWMPDRPAIIPRATETQPPA